MTLPAQRPWPGPHDDRADRRTPRWHLATGLRIGGVALAVVLLCGAASQEPPEPFRLRSLRLELEIDYATQHLTGTATCEMENWTTHEAHDVSLLLNRLLEASGARDKEGSPVRYVQDVLRFHDMPLRQVTRVTVHLPGPVPAGARTTLRLDYAGNLVGYTEVGWLYVRDHIDTSFTILRSEALAFPVIDGLSDAANRRAPRSEFTYDVSIRVPSRYVVATGGRQTRMPHPDGTATWRYVSDAASPFMNVCIAPFDTLSDGDVRVFYFPADSAGARRLLTQAHAALRLLDDWFGPLLTQPHLCITEIPDGWGSQASAVGGIIQTAAAFRDPERLSEVYHELSHLWNAPDSEQPSPRWNEGLASFLEDLMRERIDGWTGRVASDSSLIAALKSRAAADSTLRSVAFINYGQHDMTRRSYAVGDLLFATLYEMVGASEFNRIVGGYYHAFPRGGSTRDFIAFAKRTTAHDVSALFDDWMLTPEWPRVLATASSVRELAEHYRGN